MLNSAKRRAKSLVRSVQEFVDPVSKRSKRIREKEGIKDYQKGYVIELLRYCNLRGKKLLEIGGDNFKLANLFIEEGAKEVTIINKKNFSKDYSANKSINFVEGDATKLRSYFPDNHFDIVFGVAILEHMNDNSAMLEQVHSILKPRGTVFLAGNPLWTSDVGHHVWYDSEEQHYHFNDSTNPIPDWHHLILDLQRMTDFLTKEKLLPQEHATKIVDFVYRGESLNRISYSDLAYIFRNSNFKVIKEKTSKGKEPDEETLKKLMETEYSSEVTNFNIRGVTYVMKKV
jgi:ubiquinone/menaquinone biosynthesis C-methylase UbiE